MWSQQAEKKCSKGSNASEAGGGELANNQEKTCEKIGNIKNEYHNGLAAAIRSPQNRLFSPVGKKNDARYKQKTRARCFDRQKTSAMTPDRSNTPNEKEQAEGSRNNQKTKPYARGGDPGKKRDEWLRDMGKKAKKKQRTNIPCSKGSKKVNPKQTPA